METTEAIMTLRDVSAGYDWRNIVSGISVSICADSFVGIVGPNGGGKTTILRVMLGLLKPTHGSVWRRSGLKIGYMPQVVDIDHEFPISVKDVVLMGQMSGHRLFVGRESRRKAEELIEMARLGAVADRKIGEISGGQRQRAMLCRALMSEPDLLIMDEPATYMDRNSETTLQKMLPSLSQKMAIVMVSHDLESVMSMAKEVILINGTMRRVSSKNMPHHTPDEYFIHSRQS